jgi:hypothetical protein
MHGARRTCGRALAMLVALPVVAAAQSVTTETWPEVDVYWRPAVHQRTFLEMSASSEREGSKREATVGLYQDYLNLPFGYLRGGYRYTFSTRDASYRESRLVGEGVASMPVLSRFRLVNRGRLEWRWVNGDPSYRVRERIQLQLVSKTGRGPAWTPYGTFEAYYDSRYRTIARLGGRVGTEARLSRRLSTDVYLARQDNSRGTPEGLNALGVVLKLNY